MRYLLCNKSGLYAVVLFCAVILMAACASIGSPDGGPYDEEPPRVVGSTPRDKATNVTSKKINIRFNEFIKLENANEKVMISPLQIEPSNVRADGKSVRVTLYDSLKANTTYTIDFSDAITDNNEGNPMGQYTFCFSTGDEIDTLEISGNVLAAENLEPVKGILVGILPYDSLWSDTVFRTTPFLRVGRTNGVGRFTIRGVHPGRYRIFALKDGDGNYVFSQRSEVIAFDTTTIVPSCLPDYKTDTIWRDSSHIDTIIQHPITHYYPDDVLLYSFLEEGQDLHLLKTEYKRPENFTMYFTAPVDTLPRIKGLNFDEKVLCTIPSAHGDTIQYWVCDTALIHNQDTLSMEYTYLNTDTTGIQVWQTDTMQMVPKMTWGKISKDMQKKVEEWEKEQEKASKRKKKSSSPTRRRPDIELLTISANLTGSMGPHQNVEITFSQPVALLDTSAVHFFEKQDTLYIPAPFLFAKDELNPAKYTLYAEWEPSHSYRFTIDSLAVKSVLGLQNEGYSMDLNVMSLDAYGTLFVNVISPDTGCVVQLLGKDDKPIATARTNENGLAEFYYLKSGTVYMRCFIDSNGNGRWDTGNYDLGLQPERMYYFPQPMQIKAMWDIEQDWNLQGIPTLQQKPLEITKQKPDKEKTIQNRNAQRPQKR